MVSQYSLRWQGMTSLLRRRPYCLTGIRCLCTGYPFASEGGTRDSSKVKGNAFSLFRLIKSSSANYLINESSYQKLFLLYNHTRSKKQLFFKGVSQSVSKFSGFVNFDLGGYLLQNSIAGLKIKAVK